MTSALLAITVQLFAEDSMADLASCREARLRPDIITVLAPARAKWVAIACKKLDVYQYQLNSVISFIQAEMMHD